MEEKKGACFDSFYVVVGIAVIFEVVGHINKSLSDFDAAEAKEGKIKEGQPAEVKKSQPDAEWSRRDISDEGKRLEHQSCGNGAEEHGPEDRQKNDKKQSRIT